MEAVIGGQEVPEFIMTLAKASRRDNGAEATHRPISALDPSMIPLNAVIEILAAPMADIRTKLASNRTTVPVMSGGHSSRSDASNRFGGSKEPLCRGHIARLAQHHVHQRASWVNRPVQIAPSAIDFDVGLISVPAVGTSAATKIVD